MLSGIIWFMLFVPNSTLASEFLQQIILMQNFIYKCKLVVIIIKFQLFCAFSSKFFYFDNSFSETMLYRIVIHRKQWV